MHVPDEKILHLIDLLIFTKKIENASQFCNSIGLKHQNLSRIKSGKQHFTPKHIEAICKKYNVNANWIFGLQENIYN